MCVCVAKSKFRAVHRLNMLHRGLGSACRYVRACHLECSGSRLYFLQLERREALGLFGEKMEEQLRAAASQEPLMSLREGGEATQQSKRRRLRDMGLSVEVLGGARGESSQDSPAPQPEARAERVRRRQPAATARRSPCGLPRSRLLHRSWPGSAETGR